MIEEKLGVRQGELFAEDEIQIIHQKKGEGDFGARISALPYIFHDPIRFDKKSDPKKRTYGSRIDQNSKNKQEYYRVKDVLSPTELILDNGNKIKLIGIKQKDDKLDSKAIEFLRTMVKASKVFFKYDKLITTESQEYMLVYLYLHNKTFINAHLIKNELVDVDTSYDFKYKQRFIKYSNT